ncbi:MAG: hypothetical protein GIW99_12700 [Candidatus Eremiobacteraeota bacterium]|nr:hypothetical protein [Candidatus Eremiobacteraeota bacterium]MBC5828518.1 hypothetical protein [Candidatus Eremiobacteraeota bacterium]
MNPRLGVVFLLAYAAAALVASGCSKNSAAPSPVPSPSPTGSVAPDTLYVQDATSRSVRAYRGASGINGAAAAFETLPTNDTTNPDVVYSSAFDTLWYPVAYAPPTFTGNQSTPINVWFAASTKNGKNPDAAVPFTNSGGAAAYDSTHDFLYVSQVNSSAVQIFASAHSLGMAGNTAPAGAVTLVISDPGASSGTQPRAQEMLYDAGADRLYASDDGTVVAVFDAFGTAAAAAAASHTTISLNATREISGLYQPDGLAYNPSSDTLFVAELIRKQIDVIKGASAANGPNTHTTTITGFSSPGGLAYDGVRDILFVYDPINIDVLPNATAAAGALTGVPNRRVIFDSTIALSGFGIAVDTTH